MEGNHLWNVLSSRFAVSSVAILMGLSEPPNIAGLDWARECLW